MVPRAVSNAANLRAATQQPEHGDSAAQGVIVASGSSADIKIHIQHRHDNLIDIMVTAA